MVNLTDDIFFENYTPEYNQVLLTKHKSEIDAGKLHRDDIAPWSGSMYETYGEEYEYVKSQPTNKVWTIVEGDDDNLFIVAGLRFVNRLGYLVTDKEWSDADEEYEVI